MYNQQTTDTNSLHRNALWTFLLAFLLIHVHAQAQMNPYQEPHRPQLHFSPKQHWMNDPNGMVYFNGTYHLFFQHYPDGTTWGPMHWGHAVSKDLVHWTEKPIALYPDSLGYIFSGSIVADVNNSSGFGKNGQVPLVAIFTHHDPKGEKEGKNNFQNQSLAYSLDEGETWLKYTGNPVLNSPGIRDFRDPKVRWYASQKKWIMTLATKDRITFYSSPDLKKWTNESEFGENTGAHGGVWECPDLFPLTLNGKTYWVLLVSVNPGGPNGGSGTQYFVGNFNGHKFEPLDSQTKWIDYGPDNYAGVTWSNTGKRTIFLGWMSNWLYANEVPSKLWRNAMTIPRQLGLKQVNKQILLTSKPVDELNTLNTQKKVYTNLQVNRTLDLLPQSGKLPDQYVLKLNLAQLKDLAVVLSNKSGEQVNIGYDAVKNQYYMDRTKAGKTDFKKEFSRRSVAPRLTGDKNADITIVVDKASVELFADNGLTVMTGIYFPNTDFNGLSLKTEDKLSIRQITVTGLKSIW